MDTSIRTPLSRMHALTCPTCSPPTHTHWHCHSGAVAVVAVNVVAGCYVYDAFNEDEQSLGVTREKQD